MGFVFEYDAKNKILRGIVQGQLTDEILREAYTAAENLVASKGPCRGIWEFSGVTKFEATSSVIRELAHRAPIIPPGYMRVIVAPQTFVFGMMRMMQILGEKTRPELRVVRTLDEAYQLLEVKSPEFKPVS